MSYLKPQTPIELGGNYIYPLTTADQVIVGNGNRLNSLFKKTIQETVILKASNWSESAPYIQTITLTESVDDYKVDANVMYTGNENDSALNKAAGCLSYIEKNRKEITFYCLKNKPEIDIPVEITGTCRNTIATVEDKSNLNYNIVTYESENDLLIDTPTENTIGVVTTIPINGYCFSPVRPENMQQGQVWFRTSTAGQVMFNIIKENTIMIYLLDAKQMIDGVLTDVVANIWQDGKWVEWYTYLLKKGEDVTSITGGWGRIAATASDTGYICMAYVEYKDGLLHFYTDNEYAGRYAMVATQKMINLNDVTTLHFNIANATNYFPVRIGAWTVEGSVATLAAGKTDITGGCEVEVDVSTLSGSYYIGALIGLKSIPSTKAVAHIYISDVYWE